MRSKFSFVLTGLIALAGVTAMAQQAMISPAQGISKVESLRRRGDTKIIGTVIDIRQVPVGNARLLLRDLNSGNIAQTSESNSSGEYEFAVDSPGSYVVEMVMVDGYIVALSNAGSIRAAETMNTVIQLPGRWDTPTQRVVVDSNVSMYLGVSGQTTMTSQTLQLAVEQNIAASEVREPVSP